MNQRLKTIRFESRVLPSARRFKELGATTGAEIPLLEPLEIAQRPLTLLKKAEDQPGDRAS